MKTVADDFAYDFEGEDEPYTPWSFIREGLDVLWAMVRTLCARAAVIGLVLLL